MDPLLALRRLALPILSAALTAGCGSAGNSGGAPQASAAPSAADPAPAVPAPVAAPQPEPDSGSVTFLAAAHDVEVFARSEGVVTVLDVEEGRRVRAGARLAQIEDEAQRFTLQEREAELHSAEAAFQRAQKLHADKMLSEQQFIEARSEYETARARRDRARLDLERCAVRAPFAGVVALRMVQPGQMVKEGALMFRVSDPDTLRAELLLPEEELGRVRVGQRVTLFPRVGGAPAEARVTRVNPVVDAASGTFRVVIDLDNRRAGLPPGISVRCRFEKG